MNEELEENEELEGFAKICEDHEDEFLKFAKVENKRSSRKDIHAFLLLDELFPGDEDILSWAGHDEVTLSIDIEEFNARATEAQMIELLRCGVMYSDEYDCLSMFV